MELTQKNKSAEKNWICNADEEIQVRFWIEALSKVTSTVIEGKD
jgi:hypothetical protein